MERRRHIRFDTTSSRSKLVLVDRAGLRFEVHECSLLNISYGGMCFRGSVPLKTGDVADFLMDLETPLEDLVLVKAHIEWERGAGAHQRRYGARFLESSKGWLAGVDDTIQ
jgi:hypothetical protein